MTRAKRLWSRYQPTITVLAVIGVIAGLVVSWPVIAATTNQVGLVVQAAYRAEKYDRAVEAMPARDIWEGGGARDWSDDRPQYIWGIQTNSRALVRWVVEILPYYQREGIAEEAVVPQAALYMPSVDQRYHFNVAGRAACGNLFILNYRFHNYISPWYGADELGTIVHELGHVQGVCPNSMAEYSDAEAIALMESSNQVGTVEVLAAMANDGNEFAARTLAIQLRGWSMSYMRVKMYDIGLGWLYEWYARNVVYNDFDERVRRARAGRFWADKEEERLAILRAYALRPYTWAMAAIESDDCMTRPLSGGVVDRRRLEMDDLNYFMEHLPQFVRLAQEQAED